jgi:WD40 repeat protein
LQNLPRGLLGLLRDAERFALQFYDVINTSPLHVYHSALLFTPQNTQIHKLFAAELSDGTMLIKGGNAEWDACLRTIEGHSKSVNSVAISHDGTRIISGSNDNTIRIWDAQSGASLHTLEGHSDAVNSVAVSRDGTYIISGSNDNSIRIWDTQSGVSLHTFKGHSGPVNSIAISHDGTHIISGSNDNTIRIWDVQSGGSLHTLEGHSSNVYSVAISHDGTRIISGSYDIIRIWDAQTLEGHSGAVNSVAISHDGTRIISGSIDCTIRVWDAHSGASVHTLEGHFSSAKVQYVCLAGWIR